MPRLIEDPIVETPAKLEWTKDVGTGFYFETTGQWAIVTKGKKFELRQNAGQGFLGLKWQDCQPICAGPLKVCQGFAQDICDGKLAKLASGNWAQAEDIEVDLKINPGILQEFGWLPLSWGASPAKMGLGAYHGTGATKQAALDDLAFRLRSEAKELPLGKLIIRKEPSAKEIEAAEAETEKNLNAKAEADKAKQAKQAKPAKAKPAPKAPDLTPEEIEAAKAAVKGMAKPEAKPETPALPPATIQQACAILSREIAISLLPPGSYFITSTGISGRFVEMIGGDAKVDLDKGSQTWSSASPVYWTPIKIKAEAKAKPQPVEDVSKKPEATPGTTSPEKPAPAAPRVGKPRSAGIFGFTTVRSLNYMGKAGWTKDEALKVLTHFKIEAAPATVQISMRNGATGKQPPADFSAEQIKELNQIAGRK